MRRVSAGGDPNATTKPMPEPIQTRRPRHKVGHGVEKGEWKQGQGEGDVAVESANFLAD